MAIEKCSCCAAAVDRDIEWNCLPVPCFGNPEGPHIQVATISLNPSSTEFYESGHKPRPEAHRLPMLQDFPATNDRSSLSERALAEARQRRCGYFQNKPHKWFEALEQILTSMNPAWSYVTGTAVHIDLVACTTQVAYARLEESTRQNLQRNCSVHFRETLLSLPSESWIILNGSGPMVGLQQAFQVGLTIKQLSSNAGVRIYHGALKVDRKLFPCFGWNVNLQWSAHAQAIITRCWNAL